MEQSIFTMKQSIFMLLTLILTVPLSLFNPFIGLAVYYGLALLRPQALWSYALQMDWRFSWIVGGATLVGFLGNGLADRAGRRWPVQRKLVVVLALLTVASYAAAVDPR